MDGCPTPISFDPNQTATASNEPTSTNMADEDTQTMPELLSRAQCIRCTLDQGQQEVGWQFGPIQAPLRDIIEGVIATPLICEVPQCTRRAHFWGFKVPRAPFSPYAETENGPGKPWPTMMRTWQMYHDDPQIKKIQEKGFSYNH